MFENLIKIENLSKYMELLIYDLINFSHFKILQNKSSDKNKISENGNLNITKLNLKEILDLIYTILKTLIESSNLKKYTIQPILDMDINLNNLEIFSDEIKIKQILLNLVSNAVKFTMHGTIKINAKIRENHIEISIIDSGIGIKQADKQKLFSDFTEIKINEKNIDNKFVSGIGLSYSKTLAESLNYKLVYDFNYTPGSKFSLVIPYYNCDSNLTDTEEDNDNNSYFSNKSSIIIERKYKEENMSKFLSLNFNNKNKNFINSNNINYRRNLSYCINLESKKLFPGVKLEKNIAVFSNSEIDAKVIKDSNKQSMTSQSNNEFSGLYRKTTRFFDKNLNLNIKYIFFYNYYKELPIDFTNKKNFF